MSQGFGDHRESRGFSLLFFIFNRMLQATQTAWFCLLEAISKDGMSTSFIYAVVF